MEATVTAYYEAILRREPNAAQSAFWTAQLENGLTLDEFADALLLQATEVRSVIRLYQALFDRVPDGLNADDSTGGGLSYWVEIFRDVRADNPQLSYKDALILTVQDWLSTDEFESLYGTNSTNADYLSALYINILGRTPDPDGFDYWLNQLNNGLLTREQLLVEFTESPEFKMYVDDEANDLLETAAEIANGESPGYDIPDGNVYEGELFNEAPTDVDLSNYAVAENAAAGTVVGTLTPTDVDGQEQFTYSLNDASGNFVLSGNQIVVAPGASLNHEAAASHGVSVTVTDKAGNTYTENFTITVGDLNEAPTNLQPSVAAVDEEPTNLTVVTTLSVSDEDVGDTHTYQILSQSVGNAFGIIGNQLVVANGALLDFDAGVTSVTVEVQATDSNGLTTTQTITVGINDLIDELPTDILPNNADIAATDAPQTTVALLSAVDADVNDSFTFEIVNDPTGGAFEIQGNQLVLVDPSLVDSINLPSGAVTLTVMVTDGAGNEYTDTIAVEVDQTGQIIAFSSDNIEVLQGGGGDDLFTANAGLGEASATPGAGRTAQGGDTALGDDGNDTFVLTKQDNTELDGDSNVTGVILDSVETLVLINRDDPLFPGLTGDPVIETDNLCEPIIDIPVLGPVFSEAVIFEASLAPDVDTVSFVQSVNSAAVTDLQANFWLDEDGPGAGDLGPLVIIDDVTADYLHVDSDVQSKTLGGQVDELVFTLDEVRINELLVTQNAAGTSPGGTTGDEIGTFSLFADGVPSVIGSINNGGVGDITGVATHTLNVSVTDLTGGRPNDARMAAGGGAAGATAALAQVDLSLGHLDGIGSGLVGLENININQDGEAGDVFIVVDHDGADRDGDGWALEIDGGAGEETIFFEEGTFAGTRVDGGDGFDVVGLYAEDLWYVGSWVTNVELLTVLEDVGAPWDGQLSLTSFDSTLEAVLLSDGVEGDLYIYDIPSRLDATVDQALLTTDVGAPGVVIDIHQKCIGALPADFDLLLDMNDTNPAGDRIDVIFGIDANSTVNSLTVWDTDVLHISVVDPSLFIEQLSSDNDLDTLLLTDDLTGPGSTMTILQQDAAGAGTQNLTLINGSQGTFNQRLFSSPAAGLMFLPVFENWTPDSSDGFFPPQFNNNLSNTFGNGAPVIEDQLVVSDDGAIFHMGSGSDWVAGNQSADGSAGQEGADSFVMNDGNDVALGFGGEDYFDGGSGNDQLFGGDGDDTAIGGMGNDLLDGGDGHDHLDGGDGNDILLGAAGRDWLVGGAGADVLAGGDDSDSMYGDTGNDLIIGGHDNTGQFIDGVNWQGDVLFAGTGIDFLIGDNSEQPQVFTVELTAENNTLGEGDTYTIDVDGGGADLIYTVSAADIIAGITLEDIAANLASQWGDDPEGWDVDVSPTNTNQLVITNWNASDALAPAPVATPSDGPLFDVVGTPADIDLTVGGLPGVGDTYEFTVAWNGGSRTYTYVVQESDWTDGADEDSFAETAPTLTAIRDALLAGGGVGDPLPAGVTVAAAGAAGVTINSAPSNVNEIGELTVTASATDAARVDEVHTLVDAVTNGDATIEEGDIYRIDFNGDAIYDYEFEVTAAEAGSQDALFNAIEADIAANSAFHVNQGGNFLVDSLTTANVLRFATADGTNPGIEFQAQNYAGGLEGEAIDIDDVGPAGIAPGQVFEVIVASDGIADGIGTDVIVQYTSVIGDTEVSVTQALVDLLDADSDGFMDAAGFTGYQVVYPGQIPIGSNSTFDIIGDTPAVDDVDLAASVVAGETPEIWTIDFDGLSEDEQLEVTIDTSTNGVGLFPIQTFNVPYNGTVEQTLTDLGDAIGLYLVGEFPGAIYSFAVDVTNQDLIISIDSTPDINDHIDSISGVGITIIGALGNGGSGTDPLAPDFTDGGAGVVEDFIGVFGELDGPTPAGADDQDFKESARDPAVQDNTQALTPVGPTTEGTDSDDLENGVIETDNSLEFSHVGRDTFVAQSVDMTAGGSNWNAFQASGFDNDDIPYDFRGILSDAGYSPAEIGNDNADGGVKNVAYVGDWQPNIDWLAFQNADGTMAASGGNALNYLELQGMAATRDDADATAAALFDGAANLTYVVLGNDTLGQDNYLRIYYNEPGTDHAPEAVIDLVGFNNINEVDFNDIVNVSQSQLIANNAGVNDINDYFVG